MKSMRYIVTRPCLQEGSLRLLKYLESSFPQSGPATFVDDKGDEHTVQIDTERGRVWGLGGLYHDQHLGVNDVLVLTSLAPARYQVEAVVKPHAPPPAPRREVRAPPETRRVVVSSTPHVREVRVQEVPRAAARPDADAAPTPTVAEVRAAEAASPPRPERRRAHTPERLNTERPAPEPGEAARADVTAVPERPALARPVDVRFPQVAPARAPRAAPLPSGPIPAEAEAQLGELARLTGYRLEDLGGGVTRLKAELGTHGYALLIATAPEAMQTPAWQESAEYRLLLTSEAERPEHTPRLTREALVALIEHARLAPLSPVDLRGYWRAGSVDLESAASVAELVSSHLAQRGAFSFVLLTLSQQPAHSVISVPRLAERLGSGVNFAELGSILDTLTRAPFLALTPLPGGQYLLRVGVPDLLTDLAEYADVVRRRVRPAARAESVLV